MKKGERFNAFLARFEKCARHYNQAQNITKTQPELYRELFPRVTPELRNTLVNQHSAAVSRPDDQAGRTYGWLIDKLRASDDTLYLLAQQMQRVELSAPPIAYYRPNYYYPRQQPTRPQQPVQFQSYQSPNGPATPPPPIDQVPTAQRATGTAAPVRDVPVAAMNGSQTVCWKCNKPGHTRSNCPDRSFNITSMEEKLADFAERRGQSQGGSRSRTKIE